jgi:hypothetical protein
MNVQVCWDSDQIEEEKALSNQMATSTFGFDRLWYKVRDQAAGNLVTQMHKPGMETKSF